MGRFFVFRASRVVVQGVVTHDSASYLPTFWPQEGQNLVSGFRPAPQFVQNFAPVAGGVGCCGWAAGGWPAGCWVTTGWASAAGIGVPAPGRTLSERNVTEVVESVLTQNSSSNRWPAKSVRSL